MFYGFLYRKEEKTLDLVQKKLHHYLPFHQIRNGVKNKVLMMNKILTFVYTNPCFRPRLALKYYCHLVTNILSVLD